KMDKIGADFEFSFNSIRQRLLANPIAVQYPIGSGHDLEGIIDLVAMTAYYFDADEQGAVVTEKEIPANLRETADMWRHDLIEKASELDDELMERYLEGEENITAEDIRKALRKGTVTRQCTVVFCGAALKNIGVQRL